VQQSQTYLEDITIEKCQVSIRNSNCLESHGVVLYKGVIVGGMTTNHASSSAYRYEERQTYLCRVWKEKILPKWDEKKHSRKLRDLVFEGIPPSVRGEVWKRIIGNPLKVTPELYSILCEQAKKSRKDFEKLTSEIAVADGDVGGSGGTVEQLYSRERSAQKSINLDLPRTFPELTFFHVESSPLQGQLRELLEAYVCFRPDIGYTQGMSYLAAGLLLYMDPCDAFISFCNLLHRSCFLSFFSMKLPDVQIYLQTHQRLFKSELLVLYEHFERIRIEPEMYMVGWIMSAYCRALPLDVVFRVWDGFILDGDAYLFRTALGILKYFEDTLLKSSFEECAFLLSHIPQDHIISDVLFQKIRSLSGVSKKRFKHIYHKCEKEMSQWNGEYFQASWKQQQK